LSNKVFIKGQKGAQKFMSYIPQCTRDIALCSSTKLWLKKGGVGEGESWCKMMGRSWEWGLGIGDESIVMVERVKYLNVLSKLGLISSSLQSKLCFGFLQLTLHTQSIPTSSYIMTSTQYFGWNTVFKYDETKSELVLTGPGIMWVFFFLINTWEVLVVSSFLKLSYQSHFGSVLRLVLISCKDPQSSIFFLLWYHKKILIKLCTVP
jgi:hypothetical protein